MSRALFASVLVVSCVPPASSAPPAQQQAAAPPVYTQPTPQPYPYATAYPTATATPTAYPTATATPTTYPTATPTATAYPTPTAYPTATAYPTPAPTALPTQRPLLPPLLGTLAWQTEVRAVLAEDTAALSPENQARVRGIPFVVDPDPFEINAYAKCDDQGAPSIVATEGLLEAVDAIAQTRATDELYGTHTYDQYTQAVIPNLVHLDKASAALPLGIIPVSAVADPRRLSRAHEWFDEIVGFTFGHELSHHWLGHTGCANGAPNLLGAIPTLWSRPGGSFVQLAEAQADTEGTNTLLAAGRARVPQYRWTEEGGLALLDFFLKLEIAAGPKTPVGQFLVGFLNSHPSSRLRIPIVQATAAIWRQQHPG